MGIGKLFLPLCIVLSVAAFFAYGLDKSRAKRKKWRIPESVLLSIGFLGGAAGALLGMIVFRHKTRHWYFWVILLFALAAQIMLVF